MELEVQHEINQSRKKARHETFKKAQQKRRTKLSNKKMKLLEKQQRRMANIRADANVIKRDMKEIEGKFKREHLSR